MKKTSPFHLNRPRILFKALRELGLRQISSYSLYQLELRSGLMRWRTSGSGSGTRQPPEGSPARVYQPLDCIEMKRLLGVDCQETLLAEAEETLAGKIRLFGGDLIPLQLKPPAPLLHWTEYERNTVFSYQGDAKFVWEPARFGWAYALARAYILTGDERYPAAFWKYLEEFLEANPPYLGLNWVSGQEAALRLLAWVFCWQVFAISAHSTADRRKRLAQAIAAHAGRIPPSLDYARAQNNNHLLSEAAGLYTAGLALPDCPSANRWRNLGWKFFHQALQDQIDADGTYCQHSINYHRLMLQLALWVHFLARQYGQEFPARSNERLAAATSWLKSLVDPESGGAPNLGPNDGAYIMPLTSLGQGDYRPVLQSAGQIFLGKRFLDPGPWDEMGAWFGAASNTRAAGTERSHPALLTLRSPDGATWAYLRAAHFRARPGHADQLHVDLWWHGLNIARDAGTYLYNAPDPWDNALSGSHVHNTVILDNLDQMQRVGRFLFLGRAQAKTIIVGPGSGQKQLVAEHTGYRRFGVIHRRTMSLLDDDCWIVEDELCSTRRNQGIKKHRACLHWLLPDWPWELQEKEDHFLVRLVSQQGPIELAIKAWGMPSGSTWLNSIQVIRAGVLLYGNEGIEPVWGWYSPTYGDKEPALSVRVNLDGNVPLHFLSSWKLG